VKFLDKIKHYDENTVTTTMFLTKTEQKQIKNQLKYTVDFSIDGGYSNFERGRAYINTEIGSISCFKINLKSTFSSLSHQNILGSLLALNIKRETIGDIIAEESVFYIISELDSFILQEFTSIGNAPLILEKIDGRSFKRQESLEEHKAFIDSLRLDLVVSKIIKGSRKDATFLIETELVQLNHTSVTKTSKTVQENDIISIRKKGRFKILNTQKTSKKGKIILIYGKFI
jgi:RNA-binding protein YlmH